MANGRRTVRVSIRGRVQGVWFRDWTRRTAESLDLAGWVRNRRDHSVEALFAGPSHLVQLMLERCHDGPPLASVEDVIILEEGGLERPTSFEVLPTL